MSRDRSFDPTLYLPSRDIGRDPFQEAANELARRIPEALEELRRDDARRRELAASRRQLREAERAARSIDPPRTPKAVKLDAAVLGVCTRWIQGRLHFVERIESLRRDDRAKRPGEDAEGWERELCALVAQVAADLADAPVGMRETLQLLCAATATRGELRECLGISGPSVHEIVRRWLETLVSAWEGSYWIKDRLTDAELAMRRADHGRWFMRTFRRTPQPELGQVADLLRMEEIIALDRLTQARPKARRTSRHRDENFRADVLRAESIVRGLNGVFPGRNELARRLSCGKSKVGRLMEASDYLRDCKQSTGKRSATPKELIADPGVLDTLLMERVRVAELQATMADQERDAKRDRIPVNKAQPLRARDARSADRSGPVR